MCQFNRYAHKFGCTEYPIFLGTCILICKATFFFVSLLLTFIKL